MAESQTEKLFELLIESGGIYCAIWVSGQSLVLVAILITPILTEYDQVLIVAYEIIQYEVWALAIESTSAAEIHFRGVVSVTFGPALALVVVCPVPHVYLIPSPEHSLDFRPRGPVLFL